MTFLQKINDFVGELQKKDDQTKRQWLISSTAVSMTLVLILWGFYFSSTIQNLSARESSQGRNGFGATFNQGLKVITDKIGLQISKTMESAEVYLKATNSVTIQPTNLEFSNSVEPITPNKFP